MEGIGERRVASCRGLRPRSLPVILGLVAIALVLAAPGRPVAAAGAESGPIEAYLKIRAQAEEATGASEGPERIEKCEAFLKAHPEYPNLSEILWTIVDDSVKTSGFDPARVSDLLERLATRNALGEPAADPAWIVPEYYLRYQLPLDRAERLIGVGRDRIERDRRGLKHQGSPEQRREQAMEIDDRESSLDLAEARVKLARGDAAGALAILDARDRRRSGAGTDLILRFRKDGTRRTLPTAQDDWRDLTRAGAHAVLGDRARAREDFERVLMLGDAGPDLKATANRLRGELGLPPPAPREFRTDPAPAPELELKDLSGRSARLADFRGRVVLLVFWTTW